MTRIGDYELLDELGRGGMGRVYRARHVPTGALRAVKILGDQDPDSAVRFRRESEVLARAGGTGVVPVHESGLDGGRLWFAMPLFERSLETRLAEERALSWRDAARIVLELARALARCHAAGVVHRDLKPANVLLDGEGRPWVADMGCARDLEAGAMTETGVFLGTPDYAAPEQLEGERACARADVYSLGVLLYELATGELPWPRQGTIYGALTVRRERKRSTARSRESSVPRELDAIIDRALAMRRDDRTTSAADLARELEELLDGTAARRAAVRRIARVGATATIALIVASVPFFVRRGAARADELERWRSECTSVRARITQGEVALAEARPGEPRPDLVARLEPDVAALAALCSSTAPSPDERLAATQALDAVRGRLAFVRGLDAALAAEAKDEVDRARALLVPILATAPSGKRAAHAAVLLACRLGVPLPERSPVAREVGAPGGDALEALARIDAPRGELVAARASVLGGLDPAGFAAHRADCVQLLRELAGEPALARVALPALVAAVRSETAPLVAPLLGELSEDARVSLARVLAQADVDADRARRGPLVRAVFPAALAPFFVSLGSELAHTKNPGPATRVFAFALRADPSLLLDDANENPLAGLEVAFRNSGVTDSELRSSHFVDGVRVNLYVDELAGVDASIVARSASSDWAAALAQAILVRDLDDPERARRRIELTTSVIESPRASLGAKGRARVLRAEALARMQAFDLARAEVQRARFETPFPDEAAVVLARIEWAAWAVSGRRDEALRAAVVRACDDALALAKLRSSGDRTPLAPGGSALGVHLSERTVTSFVALRVASVLVLAGVYDRALELLDAREREGRFGLEHGRLRIACEFGLGRDEVALEKALAVEKDCETLEAREEVRRGLVLHLEKVGLPDAADKVRALPLE